MKTENTLENKARFFALYWGQKVAMYKTDQSIKLRVGSPYVEVSHIDSLELTPLSQISDEDVMTISRIINKKFPKTASIEDGKRFMEKWRTNSVPKLRIARISTIIEVCNELTNLGYYVGDGTEVEYGWVKFKAVTND